MKCKRCGSMMIHSRDEDGLPIWECLACGETVDIGERPKAEAPHVPDEEKGLRAPRIIHGISQKESQRIYRDSPGGQAAWERYRRGDLFKASHAKHRKTAKYAATQQRFKERRKLFRKIWEHQHGAWGENYTCPLKFFYKGPNGMIFNDPEKCNCKNIPIEELSPTMCTMSCVEHIQ